VVFELQHLNNGQLIHRYLTEGSALAFVRDVIRVGGRDRAAQFALEERDDHGETRTVATGERLVQRAIEDRAE
jgi:hypothetical protein